MLEDAGPENLRPCYALIFNEKEPVAAIAAQSVAVSMSRLRKSSSADDPLSRHEEKMGIWIRHRIPMMNLIVRGLLHTIDDHEEPPERNPFK